MKDAAAKTAKAKDAPAKASKAQKAADEEARRLARDQMMVIRSDDDDDDDGDGGRHPRAELDAGPALGRSAPAVDRFGNTLSKADVSDSAKAAELELQRAAARARREAKALAAASAAADGPPVDLSEKRREEAAALRAKAAAGGKLSNKEKRLLQQLEQSEAAIVAEVAEAETGLSAFSISVRGATVADGEVADRDSVSATDVIVPCFSVSAPSRSLFNDASLRLASGRRCARASAAPRAALRPAFRPSCRADPAAPRGCRAPFLLPAGVGTACSGRTARASQRCSACSRSAGCPCRPAWTCC